MAFEFKTSRLVEFNETDMAGIVHFTQFFRYMESVEHAFLRSIGHSVVMPAAHPPIGFPRVHASCDYRRPLRFEDLVELHLLVAEKRTRSIAYQVRMTRVQPGPREEVAVGRLVVACVAKLPDGQLTAVPLPDSLASVIEPAPAHLLAHDHSHPRAGQHDRSN
ncbi:MAG: acyl-CoA thioesterase [Verrucomicrobiota bacterium]